MWQSPGCTTAASRAPGLATPAHSPLSQPQTPSDRAVGASLTQQTVAGSQLPSPPESRSGTSAVWTGLSLRLCVWVGGV